MERVADKLVEQYANKKETLLLHTQNAIKFWFGTSDFREGGDDSFITNDNDSVTTSVD